MPCTLCHPAAILPLRRLCPRSLDLTALVIGSMAPDFGYFVHAFHVSTFAHTAIGTVRFCLPIGWMVWLMFQFVKRPLCFILPNPHRGPLMRLLDRPIPFSIARIIPISLSLAAGAFTHIILDSFTHETGWAVLHLGILSMPLFQVGDSIIPVCDLLQGCGNVFGALFLIVAYFRWLKSATTSGTGGSDHSRHLLLVLCALVAMAIGIPSAAGLAARYHGYFALRVLVFRSIVDTIAAAVPSLIAIALVFQYKNRPRSMRDTRLDQ